MFAHAVSRLSNVKTLNSVKKTLNDTATGCQMPWDRTVLPATRHKLTRPALTPANKPVLDLPTPKG